MANGDIASSVGWSTFASTQQASQGYDNDNYTLDRAAEQYKTLRDQVLPSINQPVFSVRKSTTETSFGQGVWVVSAANWWASPQYSTGFTSWSGGQLKVAKAGLYRLTAHVQFVGNRTTTEIQVTKNTTSADTANTLIKNSNGGRATTATDLVRLVAGDVLITMVRAEGTSTNTIAANAFDLTLSAEWVRP